MLSASAQEWHPILQSDSQQTPSTQWPVRHSASRLQAAPFVLPGGTPEPPPPPPPTEPPPPPPEPPPPEPGSAMKISTSFISPRTTVTSLAPAPTTDPARSAVASQCS